MIRYHLMPLLAASILSPAAAQTLIWSDNFNTGMGQLTLDGAPLTGRRAGTEAQTIMARSAQRQQVSFQDQLYMWGGGGRVRFETATGWCDWAALPSAAAILSAGGFSVEFDIRAVVNPATPPAEAAWIGFAVGMPGSGAGEPTVRTTDVETDYGFKMTEGGLFTRHTNGAAIGTEITGDASIPRHVKLEYLFSSFADGTPVQVKTTINGVEISNDSFTWNGNSGELYMELENRGKDTYFDDIKFSTAPAYEVFLATTGADFRSASPPGTLVGNFTAEALRDASGTVPFTYAFVAGEGDADNGKFTLTSAGRLTTKDYEFEDGPAGTTYSIRVRGTGTGSQAGAVVEKIFYIAPIKDDDMDQLPDDWELSFPGNTSLTNLTGKKSGAGSGPDSGDFDGDGISDLAEYQRWVTEPGYSPISLDSDGDTINDTEEENPEDGRFVTSAILADTDGDGLRDDAEYANDTDPTSTDTDNDGARDGFEVDKKSDPLDYDSRPALPPGFALVPVTDDASTGISTSKTYTHLISGGAVATVNGVAFEALTAGATPTNFSWTVNGAKAATAENLGSWMAANGGVTGTGLLEMFKSFSYAGFNTGVIQTYELSNLTPGQTYQFKLFMRRFSASNRPIDLTFTNGTDVQMPFGALMYDRPGVVLSNDNDDSAYYLSYTYVAQGTTLSIVAANPTSAEAESGSAHFYGLTNEVVASTDSELENVSVSRDPSGSVTINFLGAASTEYRVTKSSDLKVFVPLTIPLSVTTDDSGLGQAIIPASEASEDKEFYRIEK